MSDFNAKIQAILDTSKIPSQIASIGKTPVKLSKIVLDTKNLPSQIQGSLDSHTFTIKLDGVKMNNIATQATKAGQAYSSAFADGIRTQLSTGGIESSIARITAQYEKFANSNHSYLDRVRNDLLELDNLQDSLFSSQGNDAALVDTYKRFSQVLADARNSLVTISSDTKAFVASASRIDKLDSSMSTWMMNNTKASKTFGTTIESLRQKLRTLDANAPISELKALEDQFEAIKRQASAAGMVGDSFSTSWQKSFKNIASYISIAEILRKSVDVMREMAENVLDIDTAMTGLYRVTDMTDAQYRSLYGNMAKSAKEYGAELTGIIDATTNWKKLGFDIGTAQQLANITTMYQQVADLDTKTAVNNLVTAYKGFEDQLLELTGGDVSAAVELVADIFNKLGNEFAVEAADIGAALVNSASVLEMAGNSIQQTAAMATGIIEVTQDASRAGTALRTLSMRLRGTTAEELQAIGEDSDGLIEVTSKLQASIKSLTGVDITDANGQLRSTYEIMDDLAEVWEQLNTNTQANVLEVIAGKNRASDVAALLNNWDQVEAAVLSSSEAAGTAREEYDIFLDSLQAHLNRLETAWQELSYSFMDVGLLKSGVDMLIGALEALDSIVNSLGGAGTIGAGVGIFALFKNIGNIKAFISLIRQATQGAGSFADVLSIAKQGLTSFIKTPMGVATSIGLITMAIGACIQAYKNWEQRQSEQRRALIENGKAAKEEADKIRSLYESYLDSKEAYETNTGSKEDLTAATDELLAALGIEQSEVDKLIGKYGSLSEAINQVTVDALQKKLSELTSGYKAVQDEMLSQVKDGFFSSFSLLDFSTKGDQMQFATLLTEAGLLNRGSYGSSGGSAYIGDNESVEGVFAMYEKLIEMRKVLEEGISSTTYSREDLADSSLYLAINEKINAFETQYKDVLYYIEEINKAAAYLDYIDYSQDNGLPKTKEEFDALRDAMVSAALASGNYVGTQEQITAAVDNTLASVPQLAKFYQQVNDISENAPQFLSFEGLFADTDSINDYIDHLNSYREKVEYLQKMLDKIRDGSITPEDEIDLRIKYPELADSENLEDGVIGIINSLKGASKTADAEATGIIAILDDMYAHIDPTNATDLQAFEIVRGLFLSLFDTAEEGTKVFSGLSDAISGVSNASDLIAKMQREVAETGGISLSTLESLTKEFGSNIEDYFSIDADGNILPEIDKIKGYYTDAIKDLNLEDKVLEQALIDALSLGFDASQLGFDELSAAMSEAQNIAEIAAGAQKDLTYDTIESLREAFGSDFESYLNLDAAGNYISINTAALQEYARNLLVAEGASEATLAQFDLMWKNTIAGTKEAETALDRISSALDTVGNVSDYLTLLQSDDLKFVDALEQAVGLLEVMGEGYSLDDFFTFGDNGDITYNTKFLTSWVDEYIDKMVTAGDVSAETATQMKAAAKAEIEEANAIDALVDAMSKVEHVSDLISTAQTEMAENGKNSVQTIIDLYEQFGSAANTMFTSTDGGFIIDTQAIKTEMYSVIDKLEEVAPEIKQAMKDALDVELEETAFEDTVDQYVSKVQTLQDALATLKSDGKLSDSALYDLIKEFPELATETDNLDDAITKLIGTMNTDIIAEFEKQFGKIDSAEDIAELEAFMDVVLKLGEVVGETQFAIDINAETEGMENLFSAMKESVSATGLTADSIAALKQRYQDLESYDPARLFERTENGIHLNTKALRQLEKEYESLTKESIDTALDDLVDQYNDLTRQIDAAGTTASTVDLYAQRSKILQQINETSELAAQYAGLTSNFYKWEQAQSLGEEGDMYDSLTGSLESIGELYKEGLIGTNKFRTAVQLMSNTDLSNASQEELLAAYEAGYPKMQRYFQDSSDGVLHFLNDLHDLNSEWVSLNEDGSWDINFGTGNDQEIADALGINVEAVQAIMRKLSDYGFDINLDTMYSDLDTMQSKAEKAANKLKELGKTDVDFNFDATNIDRVEEQIVQAQETLDKFRKEDGTIDLSMEGAEEAQYVLATLILQKQALESAVILNVDADNIEGVVGETLRKLQTIKQQYNNMQLQASIGADTSGIQASIDETVGSFTAEEIEILGKLGIDTAASTEAINAAILGITPEMLVSVGVDETLLTAFTETNHDTTATVVYNVDGSMVSRYTAPKKYSTVHYTASMNAWTPPTKYGTVVYTAKTSSQSTSTSSSTKPGVSRVSVAASGTAYAHGTSGDWGTKRSGTALGGELGEELLVRDGKFFTIGSDSAEFFQYKRGDIIFNADQTREIFDKGKIRHAAPRGKALANGTAFSSGSGSITGSGSVITKPSGSSGSGNGSGNGGGDGDSENSSKVIDWIEIAIDRIERAINKLATKAQSAYRTLTKRLKADDDQIRKVIEEISVQGQAYGRYMQEANSVGLSADLQLKVQNGTIDITEYDGDTAELIEEYQKWYEKALDCSDAIDELHESLAALWEEKFNTIATDYSNQLSLIEHRTEMFNSNLDEIEARGYMGGSKLYQALIGTENEKVSILRKQLADLTKAMSDGVNSGEIEVGSEAWYAMQISINDVKQAIQESELAVVEFNNALRDMEWEHFDYMQDRISQITKEADFLVNLLSNADQYTDKGQLSESGMATMGLHGVNYNTYLEQAKKYADELKEIDKEIAEDPYNTTLIQRREDLLGLQQEAILAAEAEKQAIVDMVKEGINLELDSLKELIDAYTDSLDSAKDLYDYQKKIKKQTAEVASLQKQIAAYENDTSEENRARLQKLQVDLSDAMEDLQESQYDQYIKDQKKMLDDFYDDYEANLNRRLDDIDALIMDMVDSVNANSTNIANTINVQASSVGYTLSSSMASIWSSGGGAYDVISKYGDGMTEQLTTLNAVISGIANYVEAMVTAGDNIANDTVSTTTTTTNPIHTNVPTANPNPIVTPSPSPVVTPSQPTTPTTPEPAKKTQVKVVSGRWNIRTGPSTKYKDIGTSRPGDVYDYAGETSGKWNSIIYKGQKAWMYNEGSKLIEGYSEGGYIAELQKIAMRNGDNMITVNTLKRGEAILKPDQAAMFSQFVKNGVPVLHDVLNMSRSMNNITSTPSQLNYPQPTENNYEVNIEIDHVQDYNDFVMQLQRDQKFEKMVQSMTVDRLSGGSKLAKYKYRWG